MSDQIFARMRACVQKVPIVPRKPKKRHLAVFRKPFNEPQYRKLPDPANQILRNVPEEHDLLRGREFIHVIVDRIAVAEDAVGQRPT